MHDGIDCHKEAKLKMCNVAVPSSKAAAKNAAENRRMLLKTISSLRFC